MKTNNIKIIDKLDHTQVDDLLELYQNEFWCNKRQRSDAIAMLQHTDIIIGLENKNHKLIGFVRVLTDFVYRATIYDLIVHSDYRNQGLGVLLMETVLNHPKLCSVEKIDLNCLPQMNAFYAKWKFTTNVGKLTFMRRFNMDGHRRDNKM